MHHRKSAMIPLRFDAIADRPDDKKGAAQMQRPLFWSDLDNDND